MYLLKPELHTRLLLISLTALLSGCCYEDCSDVGGCQGVAMMFWVVARMWVVVRELIRGF